MSIEKDLEVRSEGKCELCESTLELKVYEVPGGDSSSATGSIFICETCHTQIEDPDAVDPNHWRCLNGSAWSQVPAVQVMAWRLLSRLRGEGWTSDLLDMMYLDEETLSWAKEGEEGEDKVIHKDAFGNVLAAGDTITLVKSLDVKGANFTAKRGTAVRNISLVHDNPEHIEGRVNGQKIVILTKFVKKS